MRTGSREGEREEQGGQRETQRRETDTELGGPEVAPTHCGVRGSQFWAPSGSVPTQDQTPR